MTPKALSLPAVLRRLGLLTVAAALAAPALPALAVGGSTGEKADAPTVSSVFAKGHDPDMPGVGMDPSDYLHARTAYFNARAGNPIAKGKGNLRVAGIKQMRSQRQQQIAAAQQSGAAATTSAGTSSTSGAADPIAPVATASWSALGPSPLPNGQTNTFNINPPVSGRATAIAIDPTDKNIVYVAAAGGGVFRTTNGGTSWTPIADGMQVLAVGALAIAPSNPSILYVGTGESNLGLDSYAGVGLYRIDGANTASPVLSGPINPAGAAPYNDGHAFTGQSITRILVSPTDPASVIVSTNSAGVGKYGTYRANNASNSSVRGIWRSTNATAAAGSVTFSTINGALGASVGVSDLTFDPRDPTKVLAGVQSSSSPGLWLTSNVWATPTPTWTRDAVTTGSYSLFRLAATSAGGTSTFYAADDAANGTVRRSTDGVTWSAALPAFTGHCGGQCWYDDPVGVSPTDVNVVLAGGDGGHPLQRSADGGATLSGAVDTNLHPDAHAIAFAPGDSSTVWLGNDGGVFKSTDGGNSWVSANTTGLNSLQFQSLAVHPTDANFSIGGTQDNGTEWMHTDGSWIRADWGDGGASAIDQSATSTTAVTMYHTYYNQTNNQIGFARITNTSSASQGAWPFFGCGPGVNVNGISCNDATQFYAPLALGPGTPNTVYFGTDRLYRSTNQGTNMSVVSQAPITAGQTLTAIGISPTTDNARIVGLSNGHVWATTSGLSTLTDVTGGWPLTAGTTGQAVVADDVKIDPLDANTAFVGLGNYFGTTSSHLWKTSNLNATTPTWSGATGLPDVPVNAIAVDPSNDKFVYAGTDIGVYYSLNGGSSFAPLGLGLPAVAVFDMKIVQAGSAGGTLRIATHGRGVWQFPIGDAAKPTSVTLSPTTASVIAGDSQQFTATAHYDDGSTADITSRAAWASSNTAIATVTNGNATSKAQGSSTISATFHGVQGTAALTVNGAVLRSLAVTPTTANVAKGLTSQLTATGTYSDGTTQNLSGSATWASDLPSVATVDTHGLVTAVSQGGPATVSATVGSFMASSAVTVTPAVVTGVTVSPSATSVALGDPASFTASAAWSDGSTTDVTSSATWTSSNTGVATVSAGVATTKSVGGSTITAAANGKSGTAALTVTAAVLRSVAVTPATVNVAKGLTTQLHATGTFSDASTQDLTNTAAWTTGAAGTATVDTHGLVTGAAQGTVAITATSGAKAGHSDVTVGPAVVTGVTITPALPTVAKGASRQLTATATWSDGSTSDATNAASWTSGTPSVASIDAQGLVTGVAQGTSVIGASYAGFADSTTLTVSAAALQSVTVSPHTASVAKGDTQAFTVTGHYSDGSTAPVTAGITWSATPAGTATITSGGVATGAGVGDASITATVNGYADSATLTVTSPMLRGVTVSPATVSIAKGNNVALTVTGTYSDGSTQDLTGSATWSSADSSVASVTGGLVHGAAQGATSVTATVGTYSDHSDVTVGPAVVTGLDVSATPTSAPLGDHMQMAAVASFSDGSTQDVTSAATWSSDATSIATVASSGLVTTKAVGAANISATYQSISHSAAVTVTGAALRSISVTPTTPSVPVGLSRQLTATGTYSDGSTLDLTDTATWSSATTSVATVGSHGLVSAQSVGTSDVSAAIGGVTSGTTVTVTAPAVTAVDVVPGTKSVALGDAAGFTATATWSDGTTTDVTSSASWSSSNTSVATMTGAVAHTVQTGTSTISALSGGTTGTAALTVTAAELRSVVVTPQTASFAKGLTQQLTVTGHYSDGSTQDLTQTATWQSGSSSIATVDTAGLVTGAGEGGTSVTATVGSLSDHATITVGPAVVVALGVTPANPSVPSGDTQQLAATAIMSDGTASEVTDSATWTSATTTVATVDAHGLATSKTQGTSVIGASYGGSVDSTTLTVTAPALRSVTVSPHTASVAKGDTQAFTVTGHYSDGSTAAVTSGIVWSATPSGTATVTTGGVATGVGLGDASITATVGGLADSATLTVTAPVLRSIAVAPSALSLDKGNNASLTATGTYSDSSTQNLTGSATWSSADIQVATVNGTGSVHGAGVGQTAVTATVGGYTDHSTVTVGPAVVTGLDVTTSPASVPAGDQSHAAATATLSDGSTQDVTSLSTWSSDDPSVATITGGVATSHAPGTAQLSATYQGFSHAATLTVTDAVLRSIAITPVHPSVPVGLTRQLVATGTYSDGSQLEVTDSATWSSGTASVATVDAHGLVTAVEQGTSTVSAALGGVSSGTAVDVTAPVVVAVGVTPGSTSAVKGDPVTFAATATWSDGSTTDVTSSATWDSDDHAVATMAGNVASTVGTGTATISAVSAGTTGTSLLTVDPKALRSIVVAPSSTSVAEGLTTQLTATGHYSDGSTQDLTHSVTWQSDHAGIATVDQWGLVSGVQQGAATVTATIGSLSAQSDINVGPPVVTGVTVTPVSAGVPAGDTQQFTAMATWSSGAPTDVTDTATWASSTPSVATVDSHGLVSSAAPGVSTISATYDGLSDSTTFSVTAAVLRSVTVGPHTASVAKGDSQTFSVAGHYSDGSSAPVTSGITWSAGTPSVASVTTAGVASGLAVGSSTVTATVDGHSDAATLTVTAAELRSISLAPASPTVAKGQDVQLIATGTDSDGTQRDVTSAVTWSSGDTAVATVGTDGIVHGLTEGAATVVASSNGHSAQVTVAVGPAVVTAFHVVAAPTSMPLGDDALMTATATMSDGTHPDVTAATSWSSSDTGVAAVDGTGHVSSNGVGSATITATYQDLVDTTTVTVTDAVLRSIAVTPQSSHVARGLSTQLTATGTFSDGGTQNLTSTATWSSADESVATVDALGAVTGVTEGPTTVTATVGTVSSHADLTVDPAVVTGLTVTTARTIVAKGETQQLVATATWSAGSPTDVSDLTAWSPDAPTVATVDSNGLATGLSEGSTTISASYAGADDAIYFTVGPHAVSSVTLAPKPTQLANGEHAALTLTGHYTDGVSAVIPAAQVIWSSTDQSVAWVSGGDLMAVGEGSSTISAMAMGKSDSFDLMVGPAALDSLSIAPSSVSLRKGDAANLSAIGMYTDGHGEPVTDPVTWSTADSSIATVDSTGLLTAASIGHTTVTATAGGRTATTGVDVTAPDLIGMSVSANPQSVPAGDHTQVHATGTYSDGSTADLTNAVGWATDNTAIATVSSTGGVTTLSTGDATVLATYAYGGVDWMSSTLVSVTAPVLRSLVVTPSTYTVKPTRTKQYVATGTFSDGSKRNVSSTVKWSTGSTRIAKVGATGVVTGVAYGTTAVRAVSGAVSAAAVSVHVTHRAPTVTGLSPAKGKVGTLITITGSNFVKKPVMTVKFGATKAGTITYLSSTKIRVRVPKGARSAYVYVTNDGGTGRSKTSFRVLR